MSSDQNHQQIFRNLEQALKEWYQDDRQSALDSALPHLARQRVPKPQEDEGLVSHRAINQLLLDLLEALAREDPEAATLLRRRYIDDETGFAVANFLGISESSFYRQRLDSLNRLTDIALDLENIAKLNHINKLEKRLEAPTYQQLFGITDLQTRLMKLITPHSDVRIICLTGIGGIGKTALADSLGRKVIAQGEFDEIAWVSARQEQFGPAGQIQQVDEAVFSTEELLSTLAQQLNNALLPPRPPKEMLPALKAQMSERPHLIILDNLETLADYHELFPVLRELSQFAWILLTSRIGVYDQPGIYLESLTELTPSDAESLVRDEAFRRGIGELADAPTQTMARIYEIAGGNPLALKLIIGQVQVRSLPTVLNDLNEAKGRRVEALYEFIYQQAWNFLDDVARRVLLAMPLAAKPGTRLEHLASVTGLTDDDLYDALDLLIQLSLVSVGGPLDERRYQIHRLTETFLHKQVTKWM